MFKDLKNKKIRFFLPQSDDMWLILFKEFNFWYLLNLLIEKYNFKLQNIEAEILFPFEKYYNELSKKLPYFKESYFVFYLDHFYNNKYYTYDLILNILTNLEKQINKPKVFIYSLKLSWEEAVKLMQKFNFVELVIRTDIEYFFYELYSNNKSLNEIYNIVFKSKEKIIETKEAIIDIDLNEYLIGGHYTWFLNKFKKSKDYIIWLLDDNATNSLTTHKDLNGEQIEIFRYSADISAMISSWRYKSIKSWIIWEINIETIKKDLTYLDEMYYEYIYIYDDCFITINKDRLWEIINLFNKYNKFYYWINIKYDICSKEVFEKLLKLNLYRVEIWLQTISLWNDISVSEFKKYILIFIKKWTYISIDLIIWLPNEKLEDYIKKINFAINLNPLEINISFWVKSSLNKLISNEEKLNNDIIKAKKYIEKIKAKINNINIILK